jgi:uncharacterized protein Yka (UPF0111/DUF47 family)
MGREKNYDYFKAFAGQLQFAVEAAKYLYCTVEDYEPDKLGECLTEMHGIEHAADLEMHGMMARLMREFITPIDREDIIALSQEIDEITDTIEDVLMKAYMYNVRAMRPDALEFVHIIQRCCNSLVEAATELRNFKKPAQLMKLIIQVNEEEEAGDRLYMQAVRTLYTTCTEPMEIMVWREMYDMLERCCDACERTANAMETIVMKNS